MESYNNGKFNLRLQVLQGLLDSMGDATSAKVNSLRQTIRRNKADTAHTATKSLDLLRQIVQDDITKELKEVVERHIELTFAPAIENIKRNRVDFNEEHVHTLCRSILEAAKAAFVSPIAVSRDEFASPEPPQGASYLANKRLHPDLRRFYYREKEVDSDAESDVSHASMSSRGRKRALRADFGGGSPARSSTPLALTNAAGGVTLAEVQKWDPNRVSTSTRFILGSKANKCLGMTQRGRIYIKYPRIFRYVGDNQDKLWLYENGLTTRSGGRAFFMVLDDVIELARLEEYSNSSESSPSNLDRHSFTIPQWLMKKIKESMAVTYEQMKAKLSSNTLDQTIIGLPSADSPTSE
uniref:DNTTIP1 dimerisation domain-containing protein n=1 Tax=Plectus sambesii TaxID=2011161 RepID=A0A914UM31_9BILA